MRINLADVEVRDFEAIPAGKYVATVSGHDMRETKDNPGNKLEPGTPMINWEFTIKHLVGGDETHKNRKVWTNTIIHEKTLFNLKALLSACGFTDEQLNDPAGIAFEPEDLYDTDLILRVSKREYPPGSGDFTNDVRGFASLSQQDREATSSLLPS
jgi:hypothetical protein